MDTHNLELKIEELEETIELLQGQLERAKKWNEIFNPPYSYDFNKPYWYVEPFRFYPPYYRWTTTINSGTYVSNYG